MGRATRGTVITTTSVGDRPQGAKVKAPGPGEYGSPNVRRVKAEPPSWTMAGGKRSTLSQLKSTPGPGTYDTKEQVRPTPTIAANSASYRNQGKVQQRAGSQPLRPRPRTIQPERALGRGFDLPRVFLARPALDSPSKADPRASTRPRSWHRALATTRCRPSWRRRLRSSGRPSGTSWATKKQPRSPVPVLTALQKRPPRSRPAPNTGTLQSPEPRFGVSKRSTDKPKNLPGPGAYQTAERVGKEGRRFTLLGRPKSTQQVRPSPGPAAYNPSVAEKTSGPKGYR